MAEVAGTDGAAAADRGDERLVQAREAGGIVDDELLLRDAVQPLGLQNLRFLEAIIKYPKPPRITTIGGALLP